MVGAVNTRLSNPSSSPGWGHLVVFSGKTLNSHSASLYPVVLIVVNVILFMLILSLPATETGHKHQHDVPLGLHTHLTFFTSL